ncbi:hypothetical protein [Streptomyces orinoci]|uniref:Molecular chaperone DnaJ n=1 Tax=Streptomyces orinoci TaxID=67339 RepID=A0ABV3JZH3_STRON|nr:hypothetical protein [Streptomyces orinoci]
MSQLGNDGLPPETACPECEGRGRVEWETPGGQRTQTSCGNCMGTGRVMA